MTITWDTDCNAPCAGQIVAEDGRTVLIQTDFDYPGVAGTFGWSPQHVQRCPDCGGRADGPNIGHCRECDHAWEPPCNHGTDGTVDCRECGVTASEFISAAADWLADHDGATADDPGYFE